jgi:hypothetical protein
MLLRLTMSAVVASITLSSAAGAAGEATPAATAVGTPRTAPPVSVGGFGVGDIVEAQSGSDWVRGTITRVVRKPGSAAVEFDVVLENGQRSVLGPRMLRKPSSPR